MKLRLVNQVSKYMIAFLSHIKQFTWNNRLRLHVSLNSLFSNGWKLRISTLKIGGFMFFAIHLIMLSKNTVIVKIENMQIYMQCSSLF